MKHLNFWKRFVTLSMAMLLLVFTAGCGKTDGAADKTNEGAESSAQQIGKLEPIPVLEDTRPAEAKEVTFTDLNGTEVTFNQNTRRIVALSGAGDLAAFGIRPTAVIVEDKVKTDYADFFEGVETIQNTQPFDAEEIMSYEPELILVYQLMEEPELEALRKIAPVIPLYREEFDFEKRLGYIGEIFGLQENADALIDYAKKTQETAIEQLKELDLTDKTVSMFYYMDGISVPPTDFWYFNKIVYDYMGLKMPEITQEFLSDPNVNPFTPISNEKIRDYEGDVVIYVDIMAAGEPQVPEMLQSNPGWQMLDAVKNDKVGVIDGMLYAEKDVLYLYEQYNSLMNAFKKAI